MNIFAHQESMLELTQFGIGIPLTDERALKVMASLACPVRSDDWPSLSQQDVRAVHSQEYTEKLFGTQEQKEELLHQAFELENYGGAQAKYPLWQLADRVLTQSAGSYRAAKAALTSGFAYFLGGGFHHGHRDFGHGFCLVNDIVIAIRKLQREGSIQTAWVIDVDAHQGDGTAALCQDDHSIQTLSIHMEKGWPLDGDLPRHHSDIDIPIAVGEEELYLSRLEAGLNQLTGDPDLALVVQGSDPFEKDALPSASLLKLSQEQMLERDKMVFEFLREKQIPQAYVMAGGYGPEVAIIYQQFLKLALVEHPHHGDKSEKN
jgi:acetoin utilization deacetylase AcuC-like enzyme